jgi:hypothetical protein
LQLSRLLCKWYNIIEDMQRLTYGTLVWILYQRRSLKEKLCF